MKVYVVLEGSERLIRCICADERTANQLKEAFHHLMLFIEAYEVVMPKLLNDFLSPSKKDN